MLIATENSVINISSIFVNNSFALKGGVISTEDSNLNMMNSTFGFSNTSSQGGHLYLKKSSVYLRNMTFSNGNSLTAGSIYGELVTLDFKDLKILNCSCDLKKGLGIVHLIGSDYQSKFENFLCKGNQAMTGTCIFAKDIKLDVVNSIFESNLVRKKFVLLRFLEFYFFID